MRTDDFSSWTLYAEWVIFPRFFGEINKRDLNRGRACAHMERLTPRTMPQEQAASIPLDAYALSLIGLPARPGASVGF